MNIINNLNIYIFEGNPMLFVQIINYIHNFKRDNSGATAIEYALIAAGIAIVIITALGLVGDELVVLFGKVTDGLKGN
jgi:pilus assembly protein Flp/PilA